MYPEDERAWDPRENAQPDEEMERGEMDGTVPQAVPPRPAPRLTARLGALVEVLVCSDFPTQLFVAGMLRLVGITTSPGQFSVTFVVALSLADAVLLVGLVLWFLVLHGERPREVLFGRRPLALEAVLGAFLIPLTFLLAILVLASLQQFAPSLHNVTRNPLEALIRTPRDAILFALVAVVSGGIREEVQRAFILHRFERYLGGAPVGLVLFSIVFGAGHIIQGWDAAITVTVLGAFWGAIYIVRGSIVAPAVCHAGFDLTEIIRHALGG